MLRINFLLEETRTRHEKEYCKASGFSSRKVLCTKRRKNTRNQEEKQHNALQERKCFGISGKKKCEKNRIEILSDSSFFSLLVFFLRCLYRNTMSLDRHGVGVHCASNRKISSIWNEKKERLFPVKKERTWDSISLFSISFESFFFQFHSHVPYTCQLLPRSEEGSNGRDTNWKASQLPSGKGSQEEVEEKECLYERRVEANLF